MIFEVVEVNKNYYLRCRKKGLFGEKIYWLRYGHSSYSEFSDKFTLDFSYAKPMAKSEAIKLCNIAIATYIDKDNCSVVYSPQTGLFKEPLYNEKDLV